MSRSEIIHTEVFDKTSHNKKRILEYRFGIPVELGDTPRIYLHLSLKRGAPPTVIYILIDELLRMTNFRKTYKLECGFEFKPVMFSSFEKIVGLLIPRLYRLKYITSEEYLEFATKIYSEYYLVNRNEDPQAVYEYYIYYLFGMLDIKGTKYTGNLFDWMYDSNFFNPSFKEKKPTSTEVYSFLDSMFAVLYANGERGSYKQWCHKSSFEKRLDNVESNRTIRVAYDYGCVFLFLLRNFLCKIQDTQRQR